MSREQSDPILSCVAAVPTKPVRSGPTRSWPKGTTLPDRCVDALRNHKAEQKRMWQEAGDSWNELGLVFCTRHGSALDAANVRRSFRLIASAAGLNPKEWAPRELRHSFVSLRSSSGVTIEEIARVVGHGSTSVTERVYRKELRPVITRGARAINELFDGDAKR